MSSRVMPLMEVVSLLSLPLLPLLLLLLSPREGSARLSGVPVSKI